MRNVFGDDFRQNEDATNWIRIGEVSSVDPAKCTARVVFDDEDGYVSDDLPIVQRNTQNTKDFWLPAVGEDVLCIFLPCGEEDGFIVGSFYADEITPPEGSAATKRLTEYPDGTVTEYDWESHEMVIKGDIKLKVTAPDIEFVGNLSVDGDISTTGKIAADGNISTKGDVSADGDMNATGDVNATGGVSANGEITAMSLTTNIKLSTHMHPTAAVGSPSPPTPGT